MRNGGNQGQIGDQHHHSMVFVLVMFGVTVGLVIGLVVVLSMQWMRDPVHFVVEEVEEVVDEDEEGDVMNVSFEEEFLSFISKEISIMHAISTDRVDWLVIDRNLNGNIEGDISNDIEIWARVPLVNAVAEFRLIDRFSYEACEQLYAEVVSSEVLKISSDHSDCLGGFGTVEFLYDATKSPAKILGFEDSGFFNFQSAIYLEGIQEQEFSLLYDQRCGDLSLGDDFSLPSVELLGLRIGDEEFFMETPVERSCVVDPYLGTYIEPWIGASSVALNGIRIDVGEGVRVRIFGSGRDLNVDWGVAGAFHYESELGYGLDVSDWQGNVLFLSEGRVQSERIILDDMEVLVRWFQDDREHVRGMGVNDHEVLDSLHITYDHEVVSYPEGFCDGPRGCSEPYVEVFVRGNASQIIYGFMFEGDGVLDNRERFIMESVSFE